MCVQSENIMNGSCNYVALHDILCSGSLLLLFNARKIQRSIKSSGNTETPDGNKTRGPNNGSRERENIGPCVHFEVVVKIEHLTRTLDSLE